MGSAFGEKHTFTLFDFLTEGNFNVLCQTQILYSKGYDTECR